MPETRARRRIRLAVESRGFTLESLDWEPAFNAGEKMGLAGGWSGTTWPGNEFGGLSVDECLADIDWSLSPAEPCECRRPDGFHPLGRLKGWPSKVGMHDPGCQWHIKYHLRWWTDHGTDWSHWQSGGTWEDGERQKPRCLCGFAGTPEECAAARGVPNA